MKKDKLSDLKKLDIKTLTDNVKKLKLEITDLILDKNMNKLKDLKSMDKKRKELAQNLTIINQKVLLEKFKSLNTENTKGETK